MIENPSFRVGKLEDLNIKQALVLTTLENNTGLNLKVAIAECLKHSGKTGGIFEAGVKSANIGGSSILQD
ncbi:MAG: hypothetical protein V1697_01145 [Candidatus Levyibacteriota bacterium]